MYQKSWWCDPQFPRYRVWQSEIGNYGSFFATTSKNPKNQNFETIFFPFTLQTTQRTRILKKWKKASRDVIILHMYTKNHDHMMYGSWDIRHNRQSFIILGHFLPFDPPNNQKNQNFEKIKKTSGDIITLHLLYHKWQSYDVWFLRYGTWQIIFCHFGPFLHFHPTTT